MQPTEPIIFVRPGELAKRLGISRETVRRMARAGTIPCLRIGRSVRFNLAEVMKHLEAAQ